MKKSKLLSGTFWMMFGSILSRVLGIIYLIPWLMMMGSPARQNAAQAIFNSAYNIYALFLSLGTAGFPTAIARQVAAYNGENKFKNSMRVLKAALLFMFCTGITCAVLLYFSAPYIARHSAVVSSEVATKAIRVMVPTLVILPPMSLMRGFFQGNTDMKPYGVSQLWEQFVRIIFILASTYYIIRVIGGSYIKAVNYSTFATFVGAIASSIYLIYYYMKKRPEYRELTAKSLPADNNDIKGIFIGIIREAIPFIYVGSAVTIFQFIDQMTFKDIVVRLTGLSNLAAQTLYTYFSADPNKITTVVVALTIAISESSLPLLAKQSKAGDKKGVSNIIVQNIELLMVTLLPAAFLLAILSWEVNGVFYPFSKLGADLMAVALIGSIALGFFTDFFTVIQSLKKHRLAVRMLTLGIVLKLVLQVPMTYLWGAYGTIWATTIAFGAIAALAFSHIYRHYLGKHQLSFAHKIIWVNLVLAGLGWLAHWAIGKVYVPMGKVSAFIYAAVFGIIFLLVYVLILNKMGALKRVFGFRLPGVSGPKKPVKAGHQDNSHAINNPKQRGYKSRYKHFK